MEDFKRVSAYQLQAIGFPTDLLPRLFSKLSNKRGEELEKVFQIMLINHNNGEGKEGGGGGGGGRVVKCRQKMEPFSDVFILQHVWTSDGGEGGKSLLLSDHSLLQTVAGCLGVPLPAERRRETQEKMTNTIIKLTGKSKIVVRQALMDSGYDLIAAILRANQLTENDVITQKRGGGGGVSLLSFEEFRTGLEDLCRGGGRGGGKLTEEQVQSLYEDWKEHKLREPVKDAENWVHCGLYKWREEEEEEEEEEGGGGGLISVSIPLPAKTKKKDIKCQITSRSLKFSVRSDIREMALIDGDFGGGRVVPSECYWTLENQCACVTLQRADKGGGGGGGWMELIVGEVQGDSEVGEEEMAICVKEIMTKIKESNLTYSAVTSDGEQPQMWYVLESEGEALVHSTSPNFACHPFSDCLTGSMMSLLWPVKKVEEGEICSRDYAHQSS